MSNVKMKFRDAPIGARFKYPKMNSVWVKIDSFPEGRFSNGLGLICEWNGNIKGHQSFCSFADADMGIDLDTIVELI